MGSTNTALPTLSGAFNYPAPTVPPTSNAPYLRNSRLPENFVFIIVGALLGFIIVVIIIWRLLSSWSINRKTRRVVEKRTSYMALADVKTNPAATESGHDMADLSKLPKSFASVPSLFYSPTAEIARQSQRPPSQHLPSGHYRDNSDPLTPQRR
ncbi:hypothetical protein DV738_g2693, partial [Chaetothyriales sp. CBS 135597]